MGRWLNRVQATGESVTAITHDEKKPKSIGQPHYKTYERPSVGSVGKAQGAFKEKKATVNDAEIMLANLRAVGRDLGEVEPLARITMLKLDRDAAAELVAVLGDLFETAPDSDVARSQCRQVLSDPKALAAAKAVWPCLATVQ